MLVIANSVDGDRLTVITVLADQSHVKARIHLVMVTVSCGGKRVTLAKD